MTHRGTRRTPQRIVPRVVYRAVIAGVGVIPFCATAVLTAAQPGCGGGGVGVASDAFVVDGPFGVAQSCFGDVITNPACSHGVADAAFSDVKHDREAGSPFDGGVADIGFRDVVLDQEAGPPSDAFGG